MKENLEPESQSAEQAVFMNAMAEVITEGLLQDGIVRLHRFGVFRLKWGEVNQHTTVKVRFTPSSRLYRMLNPDPAPLIPLVIKVPASGYIKPGLKLPEAFPDKPQTAQQDMPEPVAEQEQPIAEAGHDVSEEVPPVKVPVSVLRNGAMQLESAVSTSENREELPLESAVEVQLHNTDVDKKNEYWPISAGLVLASVVAILVVALPGGEDKPALVEVPLQTETIDEGGFVKPAAHSVFEGDTLWNLAQRYYGDHYLWPYIYMANKDVLQHPDSLPNDIAIKIPGLQYGPQQLSSEDKALIQKSYLLVYKDLKGTKSPDADVFLAAAAKFDDKGD